MPDLRAYFARLALAPPARADLAALQAVVLAHATHIPFENLDAWRGRRVSLAPQDVERKLVAERRGGWCFEQNLLLGEALRALGFAVSDYAARVVYNRPADAPMPARTHRVLGVQLDDGLRIVDVGFGALTLTGALRLVADEPQTTPHETCRLVREGDDWRLEVQLRGAWVPLYRFDLHPQHAVDFEPANFWLVHDPASLFRETLMAARAMPEGRLTLRDLELAVHPRGGETRRRTLAGVSELREVLERDFGLAVAALPDFDARAARMAGAAPPR